MASETKKYQLVLQFPLSEDFDFDAFVAFETRLGFELDSEHIVEGHEFGSDEVRISIFTDNPEPVFEDIFAILSPRLAATLKAAFRSMDAGEFRWVYPADSEGEFGTG